MAAGAGDLAAAAGSYPDLSGFENAVVVPDRELAQMRGRYIEGGEVRYFGIQMFTVWQTAEGIILTAGLEWSADRGGSAQTPIVSFYHSAPDSAGPDGGDGLPAPGGTGDPSGTVVVPAAPPPTPLPATAGAGGLETATGVVQSVQAAGDINNIGNDMRFNVSDGEVLISFGAPPGPLGAPQELLETTTMEFENGAKATAYIEHNTLGVVLKIQTLGTVLQEIRGGVGRAAQHVNVRSDLNLIRNTMNINFGLAPAATVLRANINAVLDLTRGLRQ